MKRAPTRSILLVSISLAAVAALSAVASQDQERDPTKLAPNIYEIAFENEHVRIVRITYGPGEESSMHYHAANVAVFLGEQHVRLEKPDGSFEEVNVMAGEHRFAPAGQHLPKNLADEPFELVLIELKGT